MQHTTGTFTSNDGLSLHTQRWRPRGAVRASLVLSHGYAEHSDRYLALATALTERGIAVAALDHRGHGRSEGERANVRVFGSFVADLTRFMESLREEGLPRPPFLFGHSMGAVVAAQAGLERPHSISGLILSSPFLRSADPPPGWLLALADPLARLLPSLPVQWIDPRVISSDPVEVAAYERDPLIYHGRLKASMGNELLTAGRWVHERAESLQTPLLVLLGGDDRLADPAAGADLVARAGSDDVYLRRYPGSYHEPLRDRERERVMADLIGWIEARLPAD